MQYLLSLLYILKIFLSCYASSFFSNKKTKREKLRMRSRALPPLPPLHPKGRGGSAFPLPPPLPFMGRRCAGRGGAAQGGEEGGKGGRRTSAALRRERKEGKG